MQAQRIDDKLRKQHREALREQARAFARVDAMMAMPLSKPVRPPPLICAHAADRVPPHARRTAVSAFGADTGRSRQGPNGVDFSRVTDARAGGRSACALTTANAC